MTDIRYSVPSHPPLLTTDLIFRASLADCWLVLDCNTGYPTMYNLSTTQFLADAHPHCYAPGLILCATRLSVLIFCYIRLVSHLCVPPDHLTAHTGHFHYLDT